MKFFLEFVTCCGSCSSGTEGKRLLVVQESRRRVGRRRGRLRGGRREWRPSLSSISEDDVLVAERINNVDRPAGVWRRSFKKRVSSMSSRRDLARSLDYGHLRRDQQLSLMVPVFAPSPFMF
ncbi:hypothetical protein DH2020_011392 [Rehmannia glutinosa]|uniref:Uncharacterized protein n=1 Tax=Rehmannia glutinosa TaxID=99300 RepID=A0ABR0XDA1_REHGL